MQADFLHTEVQGPAATLGALGAEAPRDYGTGRVCSMCGKPINRYHADVICYPCEHQRTQDVIDRQLALSQAILAVEDAFLSEEPEPFFEPDMFRLWAYTYFGSVNALAKEAGVSDSYLAKTWRNGRLSAYTTAAIRRVLTEGER